MNRMYENFAQAEASQNMSENERKRRKNERMSEYEQSDTKRPYIQPKNGHRNTRREARERRALANDDTNEVVMREVRETWNGFEYFKDRVRGSDKA